ncbi:MAG TPA: TIGR01777 family oxidoreductase [Polyangiaceae bacterium]|nr:TIGR01777 family oxidoreductase [Polyangiaceae bacterium]
MGQIVVSGGTGFIGRALVRALVKRGDSITVVTRDQDKVGMLFGPEVRAAHWDAGYGVVAALGAMQAVIHLAGSQAVGVRWSREAKADMIASRVMKAERLVQAMKTSHHIPKLLLCASGVGYYGALPPEHAVDETSPPGDDFLARLCQDWESAALEARSLGVRVVCARFGVVLGEKGGALQEMIKPFKWGLGGPIGSGKQIVSWIHLDDAVRMLLQIMDDEAISGPVNITSPNAVPQAELAQGIGVQLKKKATFRVPEGLLRWRFGEGADPMLTGQRVLPRVMHGRGFRWKYPDLASALAASLG